ncbi:MAG: hypothetical protein ACPGXZ_11595 [Saprospiraceae bacterium]
MSLKWLYKTSLKYSCDLKNANLEEFCKEWLGEDSLLKHANQVLLVSKVIHPNKVLLKRLGYKNYHRPDIEMVYFPDFKRIDFTIKIKKWSLFSLPIWFLIYIIFFLFTYSISDILPFLNDTKYILLCALFGFILVILYSLYEERDLTKKDFEQELYYQRMKYEEL